MNRIEESAYQPSMSTRAGTTNEQIKSMAEANLDELAMQLAKWGIELAALVAHAVSRGAEASVNAYEGIDDLRAKYAVARTRLDEFKTAGGARWQMFRSDIERAWNDFETALDRLTQSSSRRPQGDHHENPSTP